MSELFLKVRGKIACLYPDAIELKKATNDMQLVYTNEVSYGVTAAGTFLCLFFDFEKKEYALEIKTKDEIVGHEMLNHEKFVEATIMQVEAQIELLFSLCDEVNEAACSWAAIDALTTLLAKEQIELLGGDIDAVIQKLDRFFLLNPDL